VLIPKFAGFELWLVVGVVKMLEDILESTVIFFEDGVFGGHIEGVIFSQSVLEARVGEGLDGAVVVEHQ
jgi:hypothetical protein